MRDDISYCLHSHSAPTCFKFYIINNKIKISYHFLHCKCTMNNFSNHNLFAAIILKLVLHAVLLGSTLQDVHLATS